MNYPVKYFALFTLIIFLFGACNTKKNEPVKAGLLIHSFNKERWANDRDYFVAKITDLGGSVQVKDAKNDADKQLEQAKELLANGVNVLVVVPVDQFAAADIVKEAHAHNVKVISYDRLIKNCKLDYYVTTDNVEIGTLQAEYLTTIKPTGNYALIGGASRDNNSQFLYLGQMNVLQPLVEKGDITIIYNVFTNSWEESEGYDHTIKLIASTKDIDAIIAGNDAIAYGAIRALRENGLEGKVLIAGQDADLRNLQEIVAGHQTCTVYKPYEKLAATTAELAVELANNGEGENTYQTVSNGEMLVPAIYHSPSIVNKGNLKLTVISEGYQKEEEVFK